MSTLASPRPDLDSLDSPPPEIDERWTWHYRALSDEWNRLRAERARHAAEAGRPDEPGADLAECATDEFERDVAVRRLAEDERALAEVEAALDRIRRGVYGYCEITGRRIPADRLRAVPWCRTTRGAERARAGMSR